MILGTLVGPPEPEVDPEATESDSDDASSDIELLEPDTERRPHAWLYLGSHNFTPSAWGTLSGNGFRPVLNVRPSSCWSRR
jgi:tyrosyl-DNA phosphodiesterase-1